MSIDRVNLAISIKKSLRLYDLIIVLLIVTSLAFYDIKPVFLGIQALAILYSVLIMMKKGLRAYNHIVLFVGWVFVFSIYAGLSYFWKASFNVTAISTTLSIIQAGGIASCIIIYGKGEKRVSQIIDAMSVAAFALSFRFFLTVPRVYWGVMGRFSKTSSIFGGNGPAIILSYVAVITFWLVYTRPDYCASKRKIIAYGSIFIFMLISMLMGTKKGIIIFLFGVSLILILSTKNLKVIVFRLLTIGLIILMVYYAIINIPLLYSSIGYRVEAMLGFLQGESGDASTRARFAFIQNAWDVFLEHPVLGVGQDGFRYINAFQHTYSHNNYLELLSNLGLIGALVYYAMPLSILKNALNSARKNVLPIVLCATVLVSDFGLVSYSSESVYLFIALSYSILSGNKYIGMFHRR